MSFYGPRKASPPNVKVGDIVTVVKGRKVPIGMKGVVSRIGYGFFAGQSRFAVTRYSVEIQDEAGVKHWTYDQNLSIIESPSR